jgi:predicted secreted protein
MGTFAHGTVVTFNSEIVGGVTSVTPFDETRDSLETTTHQSGGVRTYIPGLQDGGDITIEGRLITDDDGQLELKANLDGGAPQEIEIVYPGSSSNTFTLDVFVTGWSASAPYDDVGSFTCTLKAATKVVVT